MRKFKSRVIMCRMGIIMALVMCGCHVNGKKVEDSSNTNDNMLQVSFLDEEQLAWKDNTLDDLHAVFNLPLDFVKDEQQIEGGRMGRIINDGGCVLFKVHLLQNGTQWSGVNGYTANGEEFAVRINVESEPKANQVHAVGPVAGTNAYVACRNTYEKMGKSKVLKFYQLDESFQTVKSMCTEIDMYESSYYPEDVMGDGKGNYHVIYRGPDGNRKYVVFSSDGETMFEGKSDRPLSLCAFGGDHVALCEGMPNSNGGKWRFYEADVEGGKLRELAVSKDEKLGRKMSGYVTAASPVDDYRLLWCTPEGMFLYDSREQEARNLYKWSNHGISMPVVLKLAALSDGRIGVFYGDSDGTYYLLLKTTESKEEIKTITFAVSADKKYDYLTMVAYFNKLFPTYVVEIRDDLDETSLLTQLGAGEGPVLIDTSLTGFEDLERLWQPLDGFLEQAGLEGELIPEALGFGKIGDVQYGIVSGFRIQTLITAASGPADWDYGGFLSALEEAKGAAPFAYDYFETTGDRRGDFFAVLENGLEDAFYVDADAGKTIFGTAEFDRVIRLSERARECQPAEEGRALREGRALCEVFDLYGFQQVAELRLHLEKGEERVMGYPTREGAKNLLVTDDPIVMRITATEEEKQIAYTFLKLMLSREFLAKSGGFPIRKDAMEDKLAEYEALAESFGKQYNMPLADKERDMRLLEELIGRSTPKKAFPSSLQRVFDEEIGEYLDGRIDAAALSDHLQNRFWLYLEEQK